MKSTETLLNEGANLKEVELMLTLEELQAYAKFCLDNDIKFNDWIRKLASEGLSQAKALEQS